MIIHKVFLMLGDDFVKVFESKIEEEAKTICDKLNEKMGEPLYYVK